MTKSQRMRESAVMISSTMPSTKYSCSGSPLILANGNTAIGGLSGNGNGGGPAAPPSPPASPHSRALRAALPRGPGRARMGAFGSHAVNAHRARDVLERLLADVLEGKV